jgi:hypothetical protein
MRSSASPTSLASAARPPASIEVYAPTETAQSTTGTLSLTITWSDGTPAADLEARVTDVGRNALEPLAARTDAAGRCTIEGLRPGRAWVTLSRMDFQRTVEVVAGTSSELALQLARGWDVEGVVVDAQGNPVAGATVWLGDLAASIDSSYAAATTAPDGSFGLRSCVDYAALWARAPGHAPSLLRLIKETRNQPEGSVVGVTLALGGAGATITGEVRDPSGAPVEGALVLVDGQDMLHAFWHTLPGGEQITLSRPGPTAVRTDASGTFTVAGVHPGTVPLGVLVPGLAPWRDSVEVAPGASAAATITLSSGFRLTGVVRDAAGNPTAARVLALLSSIQISPTVLTGPDGAFEFEGLPPGEVRITTDNGEGTAWTTLTGSAGDELTWDAFLVPDGPAEPWFERERWR